MSRKMYALGLSLWVALWATLIASPGHAQVRHRRPIGPAPTLSYHFDNNAAAGCRDYSCGSRCYDGHSGTDMPVPVGTAVLAGAAGTVIATNNGCANTGYVGNPCGGRCGNYVQLEHSDGSRTIFCHMQLNSISVSRGQRVTCGQTLGRSASSGSSSGPHLHFGWRRSASAASADSFRGGCTSAPGVWVDQRPYPASPGDACQCVPSPEVCNGRDDDCDGRIDEGLTRNCYTGPAGTNNRGICRGGTETCAAGRWGACAGQVTPRTETCNRMDDDCDGRVDDGVCAMDAGAVTDAGRDAARGDGSAGADAASADVVGSDAESDSDFADDASEPSDQDVSLVDLGPVSVDADVSPDRVDVPSGCACRAATSPSSRGARSGAGLWVLAMAWTASRARRRSRNG
ncbi:MAG: M23 family metallopeptidase [Deltaproteobacteria bacterium]|nr:M23 family metallopeptidase [Deltaproteobacteria bacterium]